MKISTTTSSSSSSCHYTHSLQNTTLRYRYVLSRAFLRHDVHTNLFRTSALSCRIVSVVYSSWRRQPSCITCLPCAYWTQYRGSQDCCDVPTRPLLMSTVHRSNTICDSFILADTPRIVQFSVLTAFHTLSLLLFPLLDFPLPHFQPPVYVTVRRPSVCPSVARRCCAFAAERS